MKSNNIDMDKNIDNWIVSTLEKTQQVEPPKHLFQEVLGKIEPDTVSSNSWISAAAVVLLLICTNYITVQQSSVTEETTEYNTIITNFDIYSS